MQNPILQALNSRQTNRPNNLISLVSSLKNGNPAAIFNSLMQSNAQFQQFVYQNKDKPIQQIAKEYNIDLSALNSMLK